MGFVPMRAVRPTYDAATFGTADHLFFPLDSFRIHGRVEPFSEYVALISRGGR
jgi:hypothetical protein